MPPTAHHALAILALAASCSRGAAPSTPPPQPPPAPPPPASPAATAAPAAPAAPSVLEPGAVRNPVAPAPRPPLIAGTPGATHPLPAGAPAHAAPAAPAAPVHVRVTRVTAAEGEDGHGNTVPASWPVAVDLETPDGWPGGALGTSLVVGPLAFHNVGYPAVTTMRFVVADGRTLPANTEVALQYGPDPSRRRVVAPSLTVPR